MVYSECPSCKSTVAFWKCKTVEGVKYKIDLCNSCGYAFVNPRPTLAFLMDYYASYGHGHANVENEPKDVESVVAMESREPNSTVDAKRIVDTVKSLIAVRSGEKVAKFLDVGCGFGFFSREAINQGFSVSAIEMAENERRIAADMTGLSPSPCAFEDYQYDPNSMSVVLMSQILEHALDVNAWMERARDLLEVGGILAIAVPNFGSISALLLRENEPYVTPPTHLNFFNSRSLTSLVERHGFEVVETQWVSRIPGRSFDRRMPSVAKPLLPLVKATAKATLAFVDALRLGIIVNVYARKVT